MERYRLAELAAASGVTPRTIRYYIAEGLLPPPVGAGPAAAYTVAHRARLALIERLKGRALSLRAIGEQLGALSDEAVRAELARASAPAPTGEAHGAEDRPLSSRTVAPPSLSTREPWERINLTEGVELHVRADRLREPIPLDALIRQARRLLGED